MTISGKKMERIAYVIHVFPKLSETFIASELAELRRRGIQVKIISLRQPTESLSHRWIAESGLLAETIYDHPNFLPELQRFAPQLLHAHFATEPALSAWSLSLELGIPFTFTAHGYDIHRKPPKDFRERAMAARAVVTVSMANSNHIQTQFNVPAQQIRVIPCGVDTDLFRPARKPEPGPPLIVCVARHVAVKNLGLLLQACAILRDRNVPFRCVMVGDGPLREELLQRCCALKLENQVIMPGAAEQYEVLQWWQRGAVAVLSSDNEGLPVSLLEAAACSLPIVATRVGGIPECIEDGVTGMLTNPGDPQALAAGIEALLTNEPLRKAMGGQGRLKTEAFFSLRRQVDQLVELWEEKLAP